MAFRATAFWLKQHGYLARKTVAQAERQSPDGFAICYW
jgi:hypothetical protein